MLTGIEEVDWTSMRHAYGPADDVPGMLRGLASDDAAEREIALDGMYGAVHHQGDVYDCTLACIPFLLELVVDPQVQDRGGIVELLTSIGGIDLADDDELDGLDPEDEEFEDAANYAMAAAAVAAGADAFIELLGDPDQEVRLAAPCALASLHGEPARVLDLLRERLTVERDTPVRLALVQAVGRIALRHASLREETVDWLGWLSGAAQSPGLRLAALAQLARCAPARLPTDIVARVTGLLEEVRNEPPANPLAEGSVTRSATLVGQLRERREEQSAGRGTPWTDELLRTLHSALGDRVEDRIALVTAQLRSPDWQERADAVWMCNGLVHGWRGAYAEVVRLVGEQLSDPEPRLREAAASWLEGLFELARPAADALAARVALEPTPWLQERLDGRIALGRALLALARCGDARAVPVLGEALERGDIPDQLTYTISQLGAAAAPLGPVLRQRLAEVELDDQLYDRAAPLLLGLATVGATEALPEVLRVVRGAPPYRRDWVLESALRALTAFGPAAREAVGDLRRLLGSESATVATAAARALWAVERDARAVLPTLDTWLRARNPGERRSAARALGAIGPAAAPAAPALRGCLTDLDLWLRVESAAALWRVTGEAGEALPVLLAAWRDNRYARVAIAECLAEMGPAALEAEPVLRAELARPCRHNVVEGGSGSHDIPQDEKLLALCRTALEKIENVAVGEAETHG
ncbi:HEAT repeat domain-containing protein [Streptomyces purpureus]|uniref:PBS lyase n=1 Tax=Streptomyces purpureus TaxID=1951 RepID=A0A918H4T0_9ACTN|nr:HEAT repeat domain-containing protein [Streptomyces purpureus]GGT33233.1 hypothetical protein GCM10014713_28470 [Streptomyces purpureus]